MIQRILQIQLFISILCLSIGAQAQIKGKVIDAKTKEPLSFITVYYEGTSTGATTDDNGLYSIKYIPGQTELTFSSIGYKTQVAKINAHTKEVNVSLELDQILLDEVVIKPKRERYTRKNNPAVELMRKVIASKKEFKLEENDYYQYNKYQKMKTSLNDLTEEKLKKGIYKGLNFQADQLEKSKVTGGYILPVSVQETASKTVYRKSPKTEKTYINAETSTGVEEFLSTGDMLGQVLADVFADVNIYENDIKLLNRRFVSPIGTNAISFYKFYIMDTVRVEQDSCIHLSFVPQNIQDFGFTGHLYVLNDSSYAVKKCTMNLPQRTGVNFVDNMDIEQEFIQLDNGSWVLKNDIMTVDLSLVDFIQGVQIERTTKYSNYDFTAIEDKLFNPKAQVIRERNARNRDEDYWTEVRQVPLSETEDSMNLFMERLAQAPAFKYLLFATKIFFENYLETTKQGTPSKIDIGPLNTFISSNYVDGTRFRFGGSTTAALNPHLFVNGWGAYGLKDKRWKYAGEITYSFNKREYFPWEFPMHNISFSYRSDVESPMDKFLDTDKDNVFVSLKAFDVDLMSYVREGKFTYEYETYGGLGISLSAQRRNESPAGKLRFLLNNEAQTPVKDITASEIGIKLRYSPGESYINTKQRRKPINRDAPIFTLSHTTGFKGFMHSDYKSNLTQIGIWNRFWLSSWGKLDMNLEAGAQWNTVPFPLLIVPAANLSYISQNDETFSMMRNMEFLNDRFVSLSLIYDMNGKLLNRIPLLRKLKWREIFKVKALYGHLSDKNNPFISKNDDLFMFPTRDGELSAFVMDNKPYIEASVGVYNIFKFLQVEYVRRLTYLNTPGASKHGVRLMVNLAF
ncbi:MAG: DUF5686 family protein [Bacteroides sp.]